MANEDSAFYLMGVMLGQSVNARVKSADLASTDAGKGAELVGFKQLGSGAVDRKSFDKLREFVDVKDFGAVGDGVTDDSDAVLKALQASSRIRFPESAAGYSINKKIEVDLLEDTIIDFNGQRLIFTDGRIKLNGEDVFTGRTLGANAARYDTAVTLSDASGLQRGDLLYINTAISPSSDWADTKKDLVRVAFVTGNVVTLSDRLNFHYTTSDTGLTVRAYRPRQLHLLNPHLDLVADDSDTTAHVMVYLEGLHNVLVDRPIIKGQVPFDRSDNIYRNGIWAVSCWSVSIRSPYYEAMSYPVGIYGGTRNVIETDVHAEYCHHGHADCGDWSSDYQLIGMQSVHCYQALNTHPVFRAHATSVNVRRDYGLSNWRCVGGGLSNVVIETISDDTQELPQFQNATMFPAYEYLYSDADFYCENVDFRTPNRITKPPFGVRFGRDVLISNTKANDIWTSFANRGDVQQLIWGEGNRLGLNRNKRSPSLLTTFCPVRVEGSNRLDAYLDSGIYHINPREHVVPHSSGRLACSGEIVTASPVDPTILTIRIHVNAFSDAAQADVVIGRIKLFAGVRHQNAGYFSTKEEWYNFGFNVSATSLLSFPTAPVFNSGTSGQDNESIDIAISNPTYAGVTQIGANGDHYVEFAVTVSSSRTVPMYSLSYDLELMKA